MFKATGATITTNTAVRYTQPASRLKSPDAASPTAADWAKHAGWSSAPFRGFITFDDCAFRFERLAFIHEAFMKIACCIICWRKLKNSFC
ncbi:hypothetical protein QFZ89_008193 [Paraburkholderia youngii]